MRIGFAFTLFLPYPDNLSLSNRRMFIRLCKWRTNLSGEQFSEPGTCEQSVVVGWGRISVNAKPFRIMESYPATCEQDRKSIQIPVNAIPMCMIKIFRGGRGGDTFKPPLPPTNNFYLYPPPVLRCLWKDPLMTPHHPTSSILHRYLLPIHHPFPPKNFDHTLSDETFFG